MPITVTIVSDDPAWRADWVRRLNQARGFHCVGNYGSSRDILRLRGQVPGEMLLLDLSGAEAGWDEALALLKRQAPALQVVVVVPDNRETSLIVEALAKGASGYLAKADAPGCWLPLLEEVRKGSTPVSGEVARCLVAFLQKHTAARARVGGLSLREREIMDLLARGYPYKQIADCLRISINTVRTYVRRLYGKLRVPCRAQAMLKYQAGRLWEAENDYEAPRPERLLAAAPSR